MKVRSLLVALALCLAFPPAARAHRHYPPVPFVDAWNKGDAKAVAAFWAEDGALVDFFGRNSEAAPGRTGRLKVEAVLGEAFASVLKGSSLEVERLLEPGLDEHKAAVWLGTVRWGQDPARGFTLRLRFEATLVAKGDTFLATSVRVTQVETRTLARKK